LRLTRSAAEIEALASRKVTTTLSPLVRKTEAASLTWRKATTPAKAKLMSAVEIKALANRKVMTLSPVARETETAEALTAFMA
jgi:hypothetical protein